MPENFPSDDFGPQDRIPEYEYLVALAGPSLLNYFNNRAGITIELLLSKPAIMADHVISMQCVALYGIMMSW